MKAKGKPTDTENANTSLYFEFCKARHLSYEVMTKITQPDNMP